MAGIQTTWITTPDKVNHNTKGYTSKIIFNYQSLDGVIIDEAEDIASKIITTDFNYKGSNILPADYFSNADGRTFRITMYFLKELLGNKLAINLKMTDIDEAEQLNVATPEFNPTTVNTETDTLVKYECELSAFKISTGIAMQGIGNIMYFNSGTDDGTNVVFLPIYGPGALFTGPAISGYSIDLINPNNESITVLSVIIEEIS
tara:strand:+ start:1922 stop:2533 length:612 start_codon:yes stop_codon:yes gene_type:complete